MQLDREQRNSQHEQFHLSFSDLFAGMVGVIMLFVLYFFTTVAVTRSLTSSQTFSQVMANQVHVLKHWNGDLSEAIYCNPDGIIVPGLDGRFIPTDSIAEDAEFNDYLRAVYGRDRKVAFLVSSGGYGAEGAVYNILYELSRSDIRFSEFFQLWIHENLDFVITDQKKAEIKREWGLQ